MQRYSFFVCSHIILSFSWVLKWYFGVRIRRPWSPYFSYLSSQSLTIWWSRCRALHRLERGRPLLICLTMSRFSSKVCFIIALFLLGFLSNFWGALQRGRGCVTPAHSHLKPKTSTRSRQIPPPREPSIPDIKRTPKQKTPFTGKFSRPLPHSNKIFSIFVSTMMTLCTIQNII